MASPITFSNISATTSQFTLLGGWYGLTAHATWGGGNATLQRLAADGSTWVTAATAITADGLSVVQLPGGQYRVAITTASAVYIDITSVDPRSP